MYDNGNDNDPITSRGLEISMGSDSLPNPEPVWQYELSQDVSSGLMSDCDRLQNGNSLLTSTVSNHLLEVSPDSTKVWELLPNQDGSTYRAERILGLYPQAFSIIRPDFIDEESGPTIYLPTGEATLEYKIHNKGWMNETYEYSINDNLGWFSETGTIGISPGGYAIIPMSGFISDSGIIDTLMFTVIPQHAPLRYKVNTLFVNSQLSNSVGNVLPQKFELYPAYPNPFNPSTSIEYKLNRPGSIKIQIFNVKGQLVETLDDSFKTPGNYSLKWQPIGLGSGQYYYQIILDGQPIKTKKAIYLK